MSEVRKMPNPGTGLDESSEATGERAARILLISASGYISSAAVASRNAGSLLPASYGPSRRANPIGKASVLFAKSGLFEFREPGLDVSMFLLQELDCIGRAATSAGLGTVSGGFTLRAAGRGLTTCLCHSRFSLFPLCLESKMSRWAHLSSNGWSFCRRISCR